MLHKPCRHRSHLVDIITVSINQNFTIEKWKFFVVFKWSIELWQTFLYTMFSRQRILWTQLQYAFYSIYEITLILPSSFSERMLPSYEILAVPPQLPFCWYCSEQRIFFILQISSLPWLYITGSFFVFF